MDKIASNNTLIYEKTTKAALRMSNCVSVRFQAEVKMKELYLFTNGVRKSLLFSHRIFLPTKRRILLRRNEDSEGEKL